MEEFKDLEEAFFRCESKETASALLTDYKGQTALLSLHDKQGAYIDLSDSCQHFFNLPKAELIGNSAYDYFHPEDFQRIVKSHALITVKPDIDQVSYRLQNGPNKFTEVRTLSKQIKGEDGLDYILALTVDGA